MRRRNGDFNPHLPYGRWLYQSVRDRSQCYFNPHLPYGRWRHSSIVTWQAYTFQSTPSLQKVTTTAVNDVYDFFISIHTFLAEGDGSRMSVWRAIPNFNPHLPRGRWRGSRNKAEAVKLFQSTPSSRKVTHDSHSKQVFLLFQSTPSSRKVTDRSNASGAVPARFQSTPSSRKVTSQTSRQQHYREFQSTPSSRKVTKSRSRPDRSQRISIHTFLAEGDCCYCCLRIICFISIHTFLAEGDCKNIYNYFFIMHIFMHYILSYL